MSSLSVSNASIVQTLTTSLTSGKSTLSQLTQQLSSGEKYDNLTDYTASEARSMINLQATATQKQAYLNVITTVSNNLSNYDATLTDLESLVKDAQKIASNDQTYSASTASTVYALASSYLKSATSDLNQTINGRYIYSGSRYTTQPVQDLSELSTDTLTEAVTTEPYLPSYDFEYVDSTSQSEMSYTTDSATVETGYTIDYGITSNDPAIQETVAGLRYLQAAGASTDPDTYSENINKALLLLTDALSSLQGLHTIVANNTNTIKTEKEAQEAAINNLTNQIADISQVDSTEVSTKITAMEATLQASYTVTGSVMKLSLANYL